MKKYILLTVPDIRPHLLSNIEDDMRVMLHGNFRFKESYNSFAATVELSNEDIILIKLKYGDALYLLDVSLCPIE